MSINEDVQMVGFRVGAETFAVPISLVNEIVRVPEITRVPEARRGLEGVIHLRGKVVPVFDLRKLFGAQQGPVSKKNRILVTEVDGKLFGLIADSASEVLKVPPSDLDSASDVLGTDSPLYVTGVGKVQGRLIITVDLTKVIKADELKSCSIT